MLENSDIEKIAEAVSFRLQSYGKRWIKVKEAAHYSSIGEKRLKKLAEDGKIYGYQDTKRGDWIFDRKSIDEYHKSNGINDDFKLLQIMRRV